MNLQGNWHETLGKETIGGNVKHIFTELTP